jgi:hypothetical protein
MRKKMRTSKRIIVKRKVNHIIPTKKKVEESQGKGKR